MSGGEEFARCAISQREIGKRNNFKAANEIERRICNQAMLGEADRDREIGDHAVFRIGFAGMAVETGRKIDRENKRVLLAAQLIDLASSRTDRFA